MSVEPGRRSVPRRRESDEGSCSARDVTEYYQSLRDGALFNLELVSVPDPRKTMWSSSNPSKDIETIPPHLVFLPPPHAYTYGIYTQMCMLHGIPNC